MCVRTQKFKTKIHLKVQDKKGQNTGQNNKQVLVKKGLVFRRSAQNGDGITMLNCYRKPLQEISKASRFTSGYLDPATQLCKQAILSQCLHWF